MVANMNFEGKPRMANVSKPERLMFARSIFLTPSMGLFAQLLSPMHGISHACSILAAGYITPVFFYHSSTSSKPPFHSVACLQSHQRHIQHSHEHFHGTWSIPSMSFVSFSLCCLGDLSLECLALLCLDHSWHLVSSKLSCLGVALH